TVRSANLKSHAGQISFPGGTTEKQDRDSVATALRETHEEIGLHPSNVEVIGCIGDIALPSGYRVTPVVGIIDNNLDYLANPAEVEAIFHAPLSLALDPEAYTHSAVTYRDVERTVLELHYEQHRIWGATAAILYHLASLI
ncbi:MAG: CoA pyrophosphatase, partial [Pseudohongiellaceae bacterium]